MLVGILICLIFLSGFFSSAETGVMAVNRYRLKHKARKGHRAARRVMKLLQRTDRLLSAILVGNNFVNILASSIATIIALRLFGDAGIAIATVALTFLLLIFGEVTPKTWAAMHPERVAFVASGPLRLFMKVCLPVVIVINSLSLFLLRLVGVKVSKVTSDQLNQEELRMVVRESSALLPQKRQGMLLGVLDLDEVKVDHIMTPRNEIIGINIDDDMEAILALLGKVEYTRLLVYQGDINNVFGIFHMRSLAKLMQSQGITREQIMKEIAVPYYIPEGTPLHTQLYNFQQEKHRLAIVVDEYGDIQGLVTLEDILEEIVGKFTTDMDDFHEEVMPSTDTDGGFIIKGTANIREINKALNWRLPTDGPKTFNGLITETLEEIPSGNTCLTIGEYRVEILTLADNKIKSARVMPFS